MTFDIKKDGKRLFFIVVSALLLALATKSFIEAGDLFPGGLMGISILIQRIVEAFFHITLPYSVINFTLNAFPIYIGFRYIGIKFTAYSCLWIFINSIFIDLIPNIVITSDPLLISIFGGIGTGVAISICLMMNATTGGTDFIAIYLSEKKGVDSFHIVLYINIIILSIAGLLFGWDKALYSIIFQYVSTQILHELYKKYQKQTLLIVTNKPDDICKLIFDVSHHGATILRGEGSFERQERYVVYSVVSSAESKEIMHELKKVDNDAFINLLTTDAISGRFYLEPNE